jgi:F-type H+-transporting ATPase subunit b
MLNLNWSTLLFQILNFVVMVFILWRFLFKKVIEILDERSERVTSALAEAEEKERQAKEMRDEYEEKLTEAQEQVIAMHQQAQEELVRTKQEILEETRQEVETMRAKAQDEIEEARQQAIYQHRRELGRLVTTLSARMMAESAGEAFQKASLESFVDRLAGMSTDEYRQILEENEAEVLHVQLVSAQDLDEESRSRIEGQVQEMAGQPIEVKYRVDPSLVAGATVRFGDVVIDGSLAGQLQHIQERYMVDLEQDKL